MSRVADAIRQALVPCQDREQRPLARPEGVRRVALISRLFPLLPAQGDVLSAQGDVAPAHSDELPEHGDRGQQA
ncbi:hypothetical protein [Streptomyces sp. LHD-70]|uniref:hypothetical protein n=1 Tax=Streptomyces sp. LHD-70 TaxID=3072140 RepID=UPI0035BE8FCC